MLTRVRWVAGLALATTVLAPAPGAEAQQPLTVERIFGSSDFRVDGVRPEWAESGDHFTIIEHNSRTDATDLVDVDVRNDTRTVLVEGTKLVPPGATAPVPIEGYEWSQDRSKLLIYTNSQRVWRDNTKGEYYVYDLATERLTPLSTREGWQQFAKFSPDGSRVGFVRDHDLFVVDLATGRETQLTHDGSDAIINGTFDWVYEEELGLQDGWRWSPDGQRIAFWRLDQSSAKTFYMINDSTLYPELVPLPYPKAGEANSTVRLGVLELDSGETTWMDLGDVPDIYLARMEWAESPTQLVLQRLNRHQNQLDVMLGDVTTGETRVLFPETDEAWVDVDDDLTWLRDGEQFLWTSERDGYNHIYLYDRDGSLAGQLTRGEWDVTALNGVDEENGWVYFTAANPSPMERQLFRVRLDGRGMERITQQPGTHRVSLSPNAALYVDAYSQAGVPATTTLNTAAGEPLRVLADNEEVEERLEAAGARAPEFFQFETSDGTALNGYLIKPPSFDPSKEYPVLMYVYGGPGSQTVTDAWGGGRYLWHQLLAQKGYIVASIDNRGTGARGRDFKKVTYQNLGEWEARDQIEGARYLASLPYVDEDRVGIWGWSYGGYMTALALMKGGDVFEAGISVAPVTAWDFYDTIYTERFMRTPQENPEGYRESAALNHVEGLTAEYLLVHGTADDNVHFQNSVHLVHALQEAGKEFDFMMYPYRTHSISGGNSTVHLYNLMTDWVEENL